MVAFLVATTKAQELIQLEAENCIVKIINSPALEIDGFIEKGLANNSFKVADPTAPQTLCAGSEDRQR